MQRAVKAADPKSFLVVLESNEVHGEGFDIVQIGKEPKEKYVSQAMAVKLQ